MALACAPAAHAQVDPAAAPEWAADGEGGEGHAVETAVVPAEVEHPAPIRRAEAHIDKDLSADLRVDRLARIAGLSRAHFVRLFGSSVGVAPSIYVAQRRIEQAERLLLATDATIEAIAHSCGFADGNYFAKAFRRANGTTPTEFRSARLRRLSRPEPGR